MEAEFTPTFATYRRALRGVVPAVAVLAVIDFFRLHQPPAVYAAEWGCGLALLALYLWLYFRNTRVTAALHSLTIRNAFGISHTVADHHLVSAIFVDSFTQSSQYVANNRPRLFILDGDGRSVLRWGGQTWTGEQMQSLATTLGIPLTALNEQMNARAFKKLYPRALSPVEAHPVVFALVIVAVIATIVIAVVLNGRGL